MAAQAVTEAAAPREADDAAALATWFREADRDGDGVVNAVEAQRFFARCAPPLSQRALARAGFASMHRLVEFDLGGG